MNKVDVRNNLMEEIRIRLGGKLPEDDEEMFLTYVSIGMAKTIKVMHTSITFMNVQLFTPQCSELELQHLEKLENEFRKYICKTNGFHGVRRDKNFLVWFQEMSKNFEKEKELQTEKIKELIPKFLD